MIIISNGKVSGIRNSIILLYFELFVLRRKTKTVTALNVLDCEKNNYNLYIFINAICILLFGISRKFPANISLIMYSIGVIFVAMCSTTVFSKSKQVKFDNEELCLSVMPSTGLNSLHFYYVLLSRTTILIMTGKIDIFLPINTLFLFDIIYWSYFLFVSTDYVLFYILKKNQKRKQIKILMNRV